MNAAEPSLSAARVAPNQWRAFGGIWRLTFRRFLAPGQLLSTAGMVVAIAVLSYATTKHGGAREYFGWTAGFYLVFLVPVMSFLSGAGAIRDEMKSDSVDYVLTRPVRKPAFVVFKYLSHMACLQVIYLFPLGLLLALGVYREIPDVAAAFPTLLIGQLLAVAAFAAFGFLCGVLTSRYLVLGMAYAGIVEVGLGQIPTQLSRLSMARHLRDLMEPVRLALGRAPSLDADASSSAISLLAFSAAMIALTALYFSLQELAGTRSKDA